MTNDPSDLDLREALQRRVNTSPGPSPAMLTRTLNALDHPPKGRRSRWTSATRWWSALAAPARFALAAAIVIGGGTVAFGTMRVTHETMISASTSPSSMVTLDRRPVPPQIARNGTLQLGVRDIPAALHRITLVARRESGSVIASEGVSPLPRRSAHIVLRIPANRLDATLQAIATFGSVRALNIQSTDLTPALTAITRQLQEARRGTAAATPAHSRTLLDVVERLDVRRAMLAERVANATVAISLFTQGSGPVALAPYQRRRA